MKSVKPLAFGKALTMLMRSYYPSPLGTISLLADERGLLGCYFVGQKYFENGYRDQAIVEGDSIFLADATTWLDAYFAGENPKAEDVVLAPQGTAFQQSAWQVLREIPYGKTMTYGEIAQKNPVCICPSSRWCCRKKSFVCLCSLSSGFRKSRAVNGICWRTRAETLASIP